MLFLPSAPTVSLTVPTSVGLPSLRVIQCSSRKLGTFISQSFESHGLMSQVEAEAEAEWPASVALLEAFSGLGFSSMRAACARRVKAAAEDWGVLEGIYTGGTPHPAANSSSRLISAGGRV